MATSAASIFVIEAFLQCLFNEFISKEAKYPVSQITTKVKPQTYLSYRIASYLSDVTVILHFFLTE